MSIYYTRDYLYSPKFDKKENMIKIFSNYYDIPIFVIRFALLAHREKSEKIIIHLIKNKTINCENLLDCVIESNKVKLCKYDLFKNLCEKKCICCKHIRLTRIYNTLTKLIISDHKFLDDPLFVNNYACLIKNTGVYSNDLYSIISEISTERDTHVLLINIIVKGNLFSKQYIDLLSSIGKVTDNKSIKDACEKTQSIIKIHTDRCSHIKDNIYVSDYKYANNNVSLSDESFSHVISLTGKDIINSESGDIKYTKINIPDDDSTDFMDNTMEHINKLLGLKADVKILCHCFAGISRSVLFSSLLIKYKYQLNFNEALSIVKNNRKIAFPNPNLVRQVKKKLRQIRKELDGKNNMSEIDVK